MKISYNWLKNYIDIDIKKEELSEILTNIGLEVGGIEEYYSVKGGLNGVLIGEVVDCNKHPNADKLSVTEVNVGENENLKIVCGAPNVAKGQKVVVATVGSKLYTSDGEFTIKKAKIRGEKSEGMICSESELGLGHSHAGIMVLDEDAKPGTKASEYFNVEKDTIFEIDLTPNRIDAASHYGVARDLAAYLNQEKECKAQKPDISNFKEGKENDVKIEIVNKEACKRYIGLSISNVKVEESPEWLKNRLKSIGINPTNNIVDISNFVMHETGQALHAFDKSKIAGSKIIVKNVPDKTKFTGLDDIERSLSSEDLMICSEKEALCIAGVLGGAESGVSDKTTEIFLESAYFNPTHVRKTAKRHGISTDSSFRFERGADINMAEYAIKRAACLITGIAGGKILSKIQDIYPEKHKNTVINFSYSKCFEAIGKNIGKENINKILKSLEIDIQEKDSNISEITIPSYRVDVTRQADVNEEILRVFGYNNIEIPPKFEMNIGNESKVNNTDIINKISNHLAGAGFNEIMCNSLIKDTYIDFYESDNNDKPVKLHNPLSRELEYMRFSLMFGGLESIAFNVNRKSPDLRLFEFGRIYNLSGENTSDINSYTESMRLGLWLTGKYKTLNWNHKESKSDFFILKSYCENIIKLFGINPENTDTTNANSKIYNYCIEYKINNTEILTIGQVNSKLLQAVDIEQDVYYAEFNWTVLINIISDKIVKYKPICKFPRIRRDLSMLIDKDVSYKDLKKTATDIEKNLIKEVNLFDVYSGEGVPKDKISYAVSFIFEDENKTLTDKHIDKIMKKIIKKFDEKYNAKIR